MFGPNLSAELTWSDQVSSTLTQGYPYAVATPMSIFGSLEVVSAGFKILAASFSFRDIEGVELLGNMGFEQNLSSRLVS